MDSGRTAVVTGASSGIGEVYARRLAAEGYDLILVARRKDRLENLADGLKAACGVKTEILAADLTQEPDLCKVEERIAAAADLEFLVNNAGFGTRGLFFQAPVEEQDRMHRLHVLATVRLSHAALSRMVSRGKGSLVNVSSVAGFAQSPGNASYCATKAWMNSFTEGLYLDLAAAGSPVKVQALCPGYTITEFHDVSGIGREHVPARWWMSAEGVVDASLRGLERGNLFVVPGWRYKFYVILLEVAPGCIVRPLALRIRGKYGR
ncbi:MAG: SDR family oxidoreductase [Deltaproteobacteria bacterium]|nr:SDR family oxidoreductase [Deltaproteobacteria bacterium]PWB65765.1 MAG: short-chain dehydrogenase [Deltaproteobacteria bacterium]